MRRRRCGRDERDRDGAPAEPRDGEAEGGDGPENGKCAHATLLSPQEREPNKDTSMRGHRPWVDDANARVDHEA